MSTSSKIEWCDATWSPTTGCDRVSDGCDHCYALTLAKRLKAMGSAKYQRDGDPRTSGPGFGITEHPDSLGAPLRWRKPKRIFVNSMSDLFHAGISDEFIARVFAVMAVTPQHTYQVLTKRPGRMRSLMRSEAWRDRVVDEIGTRFPNGEPPHLRPIELRERWWPLRNVWAGVSVEDQKRADLRIPVLLDTPAAVRFLSCEPLLGPVNLYRHLFPEQCPDGCECRWPDDADRLECGCDGPCTTYEWEPRPAGINWIICGGESGTNARPMHPDWVRDLRDQAIDAAGTPFFFKQWGAHIPKDHTRFWGGIRDVTLDGEWSPHDAARTDGAVPMVPCRKDRDGRALDGRTWNEFPDA